MADFWIKVCKDTPNKRELAIVARRLGCSKAESFYWWFTLYAWADGQTADGFLPHMDHAAVACAAGIPEDFVAALGTEDIAWLYRVDETARQPAGMLFSNWGLHNGKSAKKRSQDTQRKSRRRARK